VNPLALARKLSERGVVGMNRRNALYIGPLNPRRSYPAVDDKRLTKALAARADVPTPELYAVIETHRQVGSLPARLAGRSEFVVKPARGAGGSGIVLITGHDGAGLITASGKHLEWPDLTYHVASILSGIYSLEGREDQALIESLIRVDPVFERVTYRGVPDIRVIVYRGVPVMAMARLPTRRSDGKANLHLGAIGVGISVATGVTGLAVHGRHIITSHPDTGQPVSGIQVPYWTRILDIAVRGYEMTGLGYLGADLVIDQARGPVLLELNARPGLAIQLANQDGLERRLRLLDAALIGRPGESVDDRIGLARALFG
jgi:alpha-L-glutamate ligase-like protein